MTNRKPSAFCDILKCFSSADGGSAADNLMTRPVLKGCHCQTVVEMMQGMLLAVVVTNKKIAIAKNTLTDGSKVKRKEPQTLMPSLQQEAYTRH